uniref:17beta-estradiol 17-dehydrogenase n=1 Tax=Sarcophilus harrisii TaxID=9305 RepID=G3VPF8_SARHA
MPSSPFLPQPASQRLNIVLVSRDLSKLRQEAEDIVNNVGMLTQHVLQKVLNVENAGKTFSDLMNCNMLSMVQMTRIILPQMAARGRGVIINISSEAGKQPVPFFALYSATKAFMNSFSQAIAVEYQSSGVIVQTVTPLIVSSNMSQMPPIKFLVKSSDDFVREALDTVGVSNFTTGCFLHCVQSLLLSPLLSKIKCTSQIMAFFSPFEQFRRS